MIKAENKEKIKSTLSLVLNLAISILTMSFIFVLAGRVSQGDQAGASLFLGLSIISVLGYQVFLFIMYPNFKDRVRLIAISAVYSIALIFAFMARNDINLFFLSTFFVLLAIATSQILRVFIRNKDKTALEIITNILIGVVLILLAISTLLNYNGSIVIAVVLVDVIVFLLVSMKNVLLPSLKLSKVKVFVDILIKTHTIDVLVCLLAIMIGFSFLFPLFEPTITDFWDALWYCFTVITTIGFGDFYATTVIGRILTVLLGIYGIIVVAILTSVIVNYYNVITKKDKEDEKYIE
jgi:hypothetical protein